MCVAFRPSTSLENDTIPLKRKALEPALKIISDLDDTNELIVAGTAPIRELDRSIVLFHDGQELARTVTASPMR